MIIYTRYTRHESEFLACDAGSRDNYELQWGHRVLHQRRRNDQRTGLKPFSSPPTATSTRVAHMCRSRRADGRLTNRLLHLRSDRRAKHAFE